MKIPFLLKLIMGIGLCLGAGLVGSMFTTPNVPTWYAQIQKPAIAPPNWLFGPVWTFLFLLMGIAFALIWHKYGTIQGAGVALIIFLVQLLFNILWSAAFFGLRSPLLGLIDIIILLVLIFITINYFHRVSFLGAYLLIPYAIWVSFATILNISILILNR
ncbi:tryptophan-rich sensory protein [candidate division WOR-3 bacterium]|nr:tryptophan-rich sensory protein [candidate division WOR-3 bacterium]